MNTTIEGEGITDDVYDWAMKSLRKRPPQIINLLREKGKVKITKISVCRKELSEKIQFILNIFTWGEYLQKKKKFNFDKLFHLYLIIYLEDGTHFLVEKNERVKILFNPPIYKNEECINFNFSSPEVLKIFIERGEKRGGKDFYRYSANKNNCQKFVNDLLVGNGITQFSKFIMQDVDKIFTDNYRSYFQTVTDVAGLGKYLFGGDAP